MSGFLEHFSEKQLADALVERLGRKPRNVRDLAELVVKLSQGQDPRRFLLALGYAVEGYVFGVWPAHQRKEVLERHVDHIKQVAADVPKAEASYR